MVSEVNYCLYRNLYDIIHPSISRKNISNYKIIIDDELVPINIYYPNKDVSLDKIIIYIPNKIIKEEVYKDLAINTKTTVLVINCHEEKEEIECYDVLNYIYDNVNSIDIDRRNIIVMTDYDGCIILENIKNKINTTKDFNIYNYILLQPSTNDILSGENKLIINNIIDEEEPLVYIEGFIKNDSIADKEYIYNKINNFIDKE